MAYNVVLSRKANEDIDRNWRFLESQRSGLGHDFLSNVMDTVIFLESYAEISEIKGTAWRRVKIEKFNHHLWYRVLNNDVIILHVLHGHQDIDFL